MTFLASQSATWTVTILALLAATILSAAEWRRPDRRRLPARLGATWLATVALAWWALRPAWNADHPTQSTNEISALLWTPSAHAPPVPTDSDPRRRFALPGANVPADADVAFLPDAATWRRRFPEVGRLRILGDGLEPFELPALAGLHLEFAPDPAPAGGRLSIRSLRCPRVMTLGEPLTITGCLAGLPPGGSVALTLESPDGSTAGADSVAADADGTAGFTVRVPSPAAAGRWSFRLRSKDGAIDATLGVEVRAPALPRVLVLESAPRFDTASLRRWYEDVGGTLRARLRIGQDRYRFFGTTKTTAGEFGALDAKLLAGFDLVFADARALAALPAPERDELRAAVTDTGLGLLALADDAVLPPATVASDRAWLFPWNLRTLENSADLPDTERLARVVWSRLASASELPLPVAPAEIVPRPGQAGVVRDDQGRTLAAAAACGRGTVALTLVRETGRWLRANEPGRFTGYWSALFSRAARPLDHPARWTFVDGDDGPAFVDRPLDFVWSGVAGAPPPTVRVTDESGAAPVTLAPITDGFAPGGWRVTFWPRRAGWHRLECLGGTTLDFLVSPTADWAALAAQRRRGATARFAARSPADPTVHALTEPVLWPAGWWYGAFLAGIGFLWVERRLSAGNPRPGIGPSGPADTISSQ